MAWGKIKRFSEGVLTSFSFEGRNKSAEAKKKDVETPCSILIKQFHAINDVANRKRRTFFLLLIRIFNNKTYYLFFFLRLGKVAKDFLRPLPSKLLPLNGFFALKSRSRPNSPSLRFSPVNDSIISPSRDSIKFCDFFEYFAAKIIDYRK